tara:strand:+ start:11605 stop:12558 length:954 start_codon:yes stop_codon:yes gene_type:complete
MPNQDVKQLGKVAVLMGGYSAERVISLRSGQAVLDTLTKAGVDAHAFDPSEQSLELLKQQNFARAFISLHGRGGEDGTIQGALDHFQIPYTGSGVLGSALAMDKIKCKQIWQSMKLPTAPYCTLARNQLEQTDLTHILEQLNHDVIVKPCQEGSSVGMAKAHDEDTLKEALLDAFNYDEQVLIEQCLKGPEYTVSIVGQQILPSIRLETSRTFYDFHAKYESPETQYFCPSGLTDVQNDQLSQLAKSAYDALGLTGWGRVDVMQDASGEFYLLEVNTSPGMTTSSLVPMAAQAVGKDFTTLVLEILWQTYTHKDDSR